MSNRESNEIIFTREDNCLGCNKCIARCPIPEAHIAYEINGLTKVKVDPTKCINCGHCIEVCDHNARDYLDDTERFFEDLKKGKEVTIVASSSVLLNIPDYKKLFGYLKTKGAKHFFNTTIGTEISMWAFLKYIDENKDNEKVKSFVNQYCPAIVHYVERYKPELIDYLIPIQSPEICTSIYVNKHKKLSQDIAYISPCVGKKEEINDPNTGKNIKYNVTFKKLLKYLDENNIYLAEYDEVDFDRSEMSDGFGLIVSSSGGLTDFLSKFLDDKWIRSLGGPRLSFMYLKQYMERVEQEKALPDILDITSCIHGCKKGTACAEGIDIDDIGKKLYEFKRDFEKNNSFDYYGPFSWCDSNLDYENFIRKYNDKSYLIEQYKEPYDLEYDQVFKELHKPDCTSRQINCISCGYGSCKEFARSIFNNSNIYSNCIFYNRKVLEVEHLKEELISIVNHELRTPLTSILGSLSLVTNQTLEDVPVKTKDLIDIAYNNCVRLVSIVNDILDMEKIAAGKMEFSFETASLKDLVDYAVKSNIPYAQKFNVKLTIFDNLPYNSKVYVDKNRFIQVMTNLLSNAIKFSHPNSEVLIKLDKRNCYLRIAVQDFGVGISEKYKSRIFDKFTQAANVNNRSRGGTGLGLNISKSIIDRFSGNISFESELNKGSTFYIDLREKLEAKENKSPHILHIDDSEMILSIVEKVLVPVAKVSQAKTYKEAINFIEKEKFDLVIIDINLPDGNGLQLLPLIDSTVPKVIFSGEEDIETTKKLENKPNAYMTKATANPDKLVNLIQAMLSEIIDKNKMLP